MQIQAIMFTIIRFLHDLFTATWVGGLLLMVWVILPGVRGIPQLKDPRPVIGSLQKRMKTLAIISMVGLAITGLLMGKREQAFSGLFSFANTYSIVLSIKHILMILMVLMAVLRLSLNKKNEQVKSPKLEKASTLVLFVNAFFAVAVLFLSALLSSIA